MYRSRGNLPLSILELMEKLEMKWLAPYLPYELRLTDCDIPMNARICELISNKYSGTRKPILRPMADYEKFESDFDLSTDFYTSYIASNGDIAFGMSGGYAYLSDLLTVTNWLFANHFDVFGLIDKGLAVDINTLSK